MANLEVSGSDELLSHLIDEGEIPVPALMAFNDWQKWRAGPCRPPTQRRDSYFTTQKHEAVLWSATMQPNHGEDWQVDLAVLEAAEDGEDDEAVEATAVDVTADVLAQLAGGIPYPGLAARPATTSEIGIVTPPRRTTGGNASPLGSWHSDNRGTPGSLKRTIGQTLRADEGEPGSLRA